MSLDGALSWLTPTCVQMPMYLLLGTSLFFDTYSKLRLRSSNVVSCTLLGFFFLTSARLYEDLSQPLVAAKLGVAASIGFTLAMPVRALYTRRIIAPRTHYCVGAFYTSYHATQWLREVYYFEDAREDVGTDDTAASVV